MSNPYGIALDREWIDWAADIGVSHTVAAASHRVRMEEAHIQKVI
jgi:hypothetical protein